MMFQVPNCILSRRLARTLYCTKTTIPQAQAGNRQNTNTSHTSFHRLPTHNHPRQSTVPQSPNELSQTQSLTPAELYEQ